MSTLQRRKSDQPTDFGWYYARWKDTPTATIVPVWVTGSHQVRYPTKKGLVPIGAFDWFGCVPMVEVVE